jgi:hypothetical protein
LALSLNSKRGIFGGYWWGKWWEGNYDNVALSIGEMCRAQREKGNLMAIVARGRIANTGQDTFTSSMHHDYILAHEQYILADELGHRILYLLQGACDYIGAYQSDSVEVRGAVVGTDPSGKFETLEVESIRQLSGAP